MIAVRRTTIRRFTLAAVALSVLASPLAAQELPDAKSLVDRYVKEIGGDRYRQLDGIHTVGSFEMAAMGATGLLEVAQARPNLMTSTVNIAGLGEIRSGFNGEVAWTLNPMEGPRVLAGNELKQASDEASFLGGLRDPAVIDSMQTVERTEIGGRACYQVRLVWKSGRETFDCYDTETGLLVATKQTAETGMGPVEATTIFEEYKEFEGVKLPTRARQLAMSQEFVMTIDSVHFGALADSVFALPAEVKALIR